MPEPCELPVGKTEPIKLNDPQIHVSEWPSLEFLQGVGKAFSEMSHNHPNKFREPASSRSFLDTLTFRDDLNKAQIKMAKRAIESLRGMMRAGWIVEG
jgi:hypothetical protein